MDISKLVVGQDVFMFSRGCGNWGKVIEVTSTGVIVESDPHYGAQLIQFDKNGTADSGTERGPWKLYLNPQDAFGNMKFRKTTGAAKYGQ